MPRDHQIRLTLSDTDIIRYQSTSMITTCRRTFVKWKHLIPNKEKRFIRFLHHCILLGGILSITVFILVSNSNDRSDTPNNISNNQQLHKVTSKHTETLLESELPVYKYIRSWTLKNINDTSELPVLSSLKDKSWLTYSKNELFRWNELPIHFVHEALQRLSKSSDSIYENGTYGDLGAAVVVPKTLVKESKSKMSLHQLNLVASDIMSLNRRLGDQRNPR